MSNAASILPGTRVRTADGFIGTVERLDHHWTDSAEQPDRMIVRSDDGRWRYSIPLMFVSSISQGPFHPIAQLQFSPDELTHYIVEQIDPHRPTKTPQSVREDTHAQPNGAEPLLRVPLAVEDLIAHKEPRLRGKIHVHKGVEITEQRVTLPLYHEEATVEHIPADQYNADAPTDPNEVVIPVLEERLVVQKQSVVKEYIRIRKNLVREEKQVRGNVCRELLSLSEERLGDATADTYPLLREMPSGAEGTDTGAQPASSPQG